jgi:ABC-type glutathione transport system ATPase component
MCDISSGWVDASQSQPADLYAKWALQYAVDAAKGMKLQVGQPAGGAPTLQMVSYRGDGNLGDPVVAPFVTKTKQNLTVTGVDGLLGTVSTTPVTDATLWGNVYGAGARRSLQRVRFDRMTVQQQPAVEVAGISKQFGSTQALRGVDLELGGGQCLGLVGRNGAGKSTPVSILSGILTPDAGNIRFDGQPADPGDHVRLGVRGGRG